LNLTDHLLIIKAKNHRPRLLARKYAFGCRKSPFGSDKFQNRPKTAVLLNETGQYAKIAGKFGGLV
jgi:hypothetical protein